MTLLELVNRLRDRLRRDSLSAELEEELRFHRQMLERDELASSAAEAAADATVRARLRFGNPTYIKEETRNMWSLGLLDDMMSDVRYVMRALVSTPAFSLIVTLTLALGVGATTAMYSVVDAVLLRPLAYPAPDQLVQLVDVQGSREIPASYPEYLDWKAATTDVLSDVGTWFGSGEVLQGSGYAEQLQGAHVSVNLPSMLGVTPLVGRLFRADEEQASAPRVIMLGESFWRRRFAGDASIVGRTITLTGNPYVVVGVVPSAARAVLPTPRFLSGAQAVDFWIPLRIAEETAPRGLHWLGVIGRVRSGVTIDAACARLAAIATALQHERGSTHGIHANSLTSALLGDVRSPLELLLTAVAMLLVIACANVASLMLARSATRTREFAVRAALGAGQPRLLRLVLAESVARAVIGGACGVLLAYGLVAVARASLGGTMPRMASASIDARVLGVALLLSIVSGLLFGTAPALRAARVSLVSDLRDGGRGAAGSSARDRLRRWLIIGEIALSFMLLATAGLLSRSLVKLLAVPAGFDTNDLVAGSTWLPSDRYKDSLAVAAFYGRLVSELDARLGRGRVTLASDLPIAGGTDGGVMVEGRANSMHDDSAPNAEKRIVGRGYFDVLGARFVSGRTFTTADVLGGPGAVIVNQTFAKQVFPGENPIGKRVGFNWGIDGFQTIVGVVADLREGPANQPARPAIYISSEQRPNSSMFVVARTPLAVPVVAAAMRDALHAVDPLVPLVSVQTMSDVRYADVRQQRVTALLLGSLAIAALVLAAVGLYGVVSYSVAQRTQELGVRAALGAQQRDLMRLVLGQTLSFAAAGVIVGAAGAIGVRKLVTLQLFGVGPNDPATFLAAAALLGGVALLAAAVPTLRAGRADPLEALRAE